jgi:hypothetical protein
MMDEISTMLDGGSSALIEVALDSSHGRCRLMRSPNRVVFGAAAGFSAALFFALTSVLLSQTPAAPAGQPPAVLPGSPSPPPAGAYVGSGACRRCHAPIYERWSKTRMANVVTDPKQHAELVLPDFGKADPLRTFRLEDVAFVYGTKWKQRYFTKVGDDYFPLPAQWDITHKVWRPYLVQPNTDWWVPFYPGDNTKRPTGPLCDGCHSVNYNIQTKTVVEWNVGCERCHGPGSEHVRTPSPSTIVNPGRLRPRERHLHAVSFAGPASEQPDRRALLRLAGRLSPGWVTQGLLEARGPQARRHHLHALRRRNRPQESDARQRLRAEPDVRARRHVLQLP